MDLQSGKTKPSLWSLLVKKPGNGSGDGHVIGSRSVYDRRHHIMQLQLISPLLFDNPYTNDQMDSWFEEGKFVSSARVTENDFNSKLAHQAMKEAYLFVEMYNEYLSVASEETWSAAKVSEKKHGSSLEAILTELLANEWFEEICRSYQCSYKTTARNQVSTALLICIFHYHTAESGKEDVVQIFENTCEDNLEMCKNYHSKGNDDFKRDFWDLALRNYTMGLKLHPYYEVLYSNRSQTYLKLNKYKEAEFDAQRAVCLKCDWPKSYHRLVESVERQGNLHHALELATEGLDLCEETISQEDRLLLMELISQLKKKLNLSSGDSTELSENNTPISVTFDHGPNMIRVSINRESDANTLPELLSTDSETEDFPRYNGESNKFIKLKKSKKYARPKTSDAATSMPDLPIPVTETTKTTAPPLPTIQRQRSESETRISLVEFKAYIADASVALLAQKCRQASYFYGKALKDLAYLDGQLPEKEIVLIKYASGFAFSNSGVHTDMVKAISLFEEIISNHKKITFPLTYYGMAHCYYKQNRFKEALIAVNKCIEAIESKPLDSSLTWPGTSVVIEDNEGLKVALKKLEETCKNPPRPDALCRFDKGDHLKPEIYLSDPDFKGYVKVTCLERCILQYHPSCWKSLKEELLQSNDKEFLGRECLTPDCDSSIIEINHIGNDGEVAKKFVHQSDGATRTGTKQKRSKLEKKLQAKRQKKLQKAAAESVADPDAESPAPENSNMSAARDSSMALEEDKEKPNLASTIYKEDGVNAISTPSNVSDRPANIPDKQLHLQLPANADTATAPVAMGKTVMLKKDDDEIIKSKSSAHKSERIRKKDKKKQVLTIDEFLGAHHNDVAFVSRYAQRLSKLNAQRNRVEEGKNVCISPNTFLKLDQDEPFHIPDHLRQDYEEVQRMMSNATEEESETTRAIKENFVSYMKDFMKGTGPLHLEDSRLMEEMANLPTELQELICNAGGFKEFMVKSQQFIVLQDHIYCLDYTPRGRDVGSQFFDEFKGNKTSLYNEQGNSLGGNMPNGKVDTLDSFDTEPIPYDRTQISVAEVARHESSSESEVSDSDLIYDESDKTEDESCSETSKEVDDEFRDAHVTLEPDSSEDEDDDDDEMSDYSDDDDEAEYESEPSDKNKTLVEAERDVYVKGDMTTSSQDTVQDVQDIFLKNSRRVQKAPTNESVPVSIGHLSYATRSGSLDSTSSSSCDISVSGERPNDFPRRRYLDKFLQFVPKFSEKGQNQVLCLLLRIIQNEDILHQHMKDTSGLDNIIRNLRLATGVLHPVINKAVQTMPDENEYKLRIENSKYEEKVSELVQKLQLSELAHQSAEAVKQEHTAELQQRDQDLDNTWRELRSLKEQLEAVARDKATSEKKLEEALASLDKHKADLDAERKLRIQAHDLTLRLQAQLNAAKALPSTQEKLRAGLLPTRPDLQEQEARLPRYERPVSLMSINVPPPQPMPVQATMIPQTLPWTSLSMQPGGFLPSSSGRSLTGQPLISSAPVVPATIAIDPAHLRSIRNGLPSHPPNNPTIETAVPKSVPSPIPTIKHSSASSRVALDDFDDTRNSVAASSSKAVASNQQGKTCKPSNSDHETKRPTPQPPPQVGTQQAHPPQFSSGTRNSFEKLMGMLQPKFPNCSRSDLRMLVQQLRVRRNNTLTGLTLDQIIHELSKLMDKQKQGAIPKSAVPKAPFSSKSMGLDRIAEPGVAWQRVPSEKCQWEVNQTEEDPCIICHEEMVGSDICQLQCLHRFHHTCIRQWFREQNTCPTCRVHSVLPDEFPPLA